MTQEKAPITSSNVEKVVVKRQDRKGYIQFLKAIKDKIDAGYEMLLEPPYRPKEYPRVAFFVKKGEGHLTEVAPKPVEPETSAPVAEDVQKPEAEVNPLVAAVEELKGKEELLKFAEDNSIEVPEDIKHPLAIKKHIKSCL